MRVIILCAIALLCACGGMGSGTGTATYDNLAAIDFDNMTQEEKDKAAYEIFEKFCDTCKAQSLVDFLDALDLEVQERNNAPGQTERFDRSKALKFNVYKDLEGGFISISANVKIVESNRLYPRHQFGDIEWIGAALDYKKSNPFITVTAGISIKKHDGSYHVESYESNGIPLLDVYGRPIRTYLKK